ISPILIILACCCPSASWNEAKAKATSRTRAVFLPIPALFTAVHCRLSTTFFLALFTGYGIGGGHVTNRILSTPHACCLAPSRFGLEYPRSDALGCHRLSSPSTREPTDHRQGESSAGKTSVVHQPMAGEGTRCSCCRS